jgi:phosphomannomutase
MVTASHNPPRDNGYKVYLGGADEGSQIVPPADAEIAAEIARVAEGSIAELRRSTEFAVADDGVVEAYARATVEAAAASASGAGTGTGGGLGPREDLRVVYTPLHGVGLEVLERVFAAAGLPAPLVVPAQAQPDPDFPTVAFPNPEEPGALDLAFAAARDADADLIIANDPDADRLAVAIPDPATTSGWRRLSGNEVGTLLGWAAAEEVASAPRAAAGGGSPPDSRPGSPAVLAASLVSSPALGRIAAHFGLRHVETLTGFKWISRVPDLVFGYEEALGYLVDPDKVRDKDGISAALRFVDLATRWRAEGRGVADVLAQIGTAIGGSASGQVSVRVTDLAEIAATMARLRARPPAGIAGRAVVEATDFAGGVGAFPPSDILRYALADGSRVVVRPSGTEPKLKAYLDAGTPEAITELDAAVRALLAEQ